MFRTDIPQYGSSTHSLDSVPGKAPTCTRVHSLGKYPQRTTQYTHVQYSTPFVDSQWTIRKATSKLQAPLPDSQEDEWFDTNPV